MNSQRRLKSVVFAMTGCTNTIGGIATHNRNVIQAVAELCVSRSLKLSVLSYLEDAGARPTFLSDRHGFRTFDGRRQSYATALIREALQARLLIFDHVTLALPVLPLAALGVSNTVIFAHGSESWRQVRMTSRWCFRTATLCLTNSQFTLNKMRERLGSFQGKACPLGLSPQFSLRREIPESPASPPVLEAEDGTRRPLSSRVLLLVARLNPAEGEKGHFELVRCLPRLRRRHPEVQLVFPGPGDAADAVGELARGLNVADAVFLPGYVETATLERLYAWCYAYVMPSRQEGFGLTFLEAMNFGKACVGCREDGAEDVIVDGVTGRLLQDAKDEDELVHVLDKLLSDPDGTRAMGIAGFRRLHEQFTACHAQRRIRESLAEVLR